MPIPDKTWSEHVRNALDCYDASLLRQVTESLCRPRSQWSADELLDRCLATLDNAATLDRRLKDLDASARSLLTLVAHSGQARWTIAALSEFVSFVHEGDPGTILLTLLKSGLIYPWIDGKKISRIKRFDESWLENAVSSGQTIWAPPLVLSRALGFGLDLAELPGGIESSAAVQEADGMEWLLRLAAVWQQVRANPLRRTQQGDFFKRDLDRLRTDPLLASSGGDSKVAVLDPALLAVAWGLSCGLLREDDGEIHAADFPHDWQQDLATTIAHLWRSLLEVENWNPSQGWHVENVPHVPYASAYALILLALSGLAKERWVSAEEIARWTAERHPHWAGRRNILAFRAATKTAAEPSDGLVTFLLGLAYPLRLVQAVQENGEWLVRLSPLGRSLLGSDEHVTLAPAYPQTLLVQPNLEVLVYRQGLTPALIARISRFAQWKTLGAACTAQLQADTVYNALEAGETFDSIVDLLNRHGTKPMPTSVVESLRTWANKRERLALYPSAALLEFATPELLNDALARGVPAVRISERLAVVTNEASIDYRHFKLIATRDYTLPPEKCVDIETDGVTLSVDVGRSDLLLETEVERFAEVMAQPSANGRRFFRLTPASLNAARQNGFDVPALETWFAQRCQEPLSPAVRLLLNAGQTQPLHLRHHLVLHVADEATADGLRQWPGTRALIEDRLGPTALLVLEENVEELMRRLGNLGVSVQRT